MSRHTSVEAFRDINSSGKLGEMQIKVYNALYQKGPLTGRELDQMLGRHSDKAASFHKRLAELKRWGVVIEVGERPDKFTGQNSIEWDVTANKPVDPLPRLSLKSRIDLAMGILTEMGNVVQDAFVRSALDRALVALEGKLSPPKKSKKGEQLSLV